MLNESDIREYNDVFERYTLTVFLPSPFLLKMPWRFQISIVFSLIAMICQEICSKSYMVEDRNAKSPLPVDVRRSKTSLLHYEFLGDGRKSYIITYYIMTP